MLRTVSKLWASSMSIPSVKAAVASVPSAVSAVGTVTALRQPMLAAFVPTRSFAVAPAAITTAQQVAAIPAGVTVTRSRFADIIKKHKPTTNGQRHHISLRRDDLWSGKYVQVACCFVFILHACHRVVVDYLQCVFSWCLNTTQHHSLSATSSFYLRFRCTLRPIISPLSSSPLPDPFAN